MWLLLVGCIIAPVVSAEKEQAAVVDPSGWFRLRLNDAEYAEALERTWPAAEAEIRRIEQAPPPPERGAIVTKITADSQAEAAGIVVGDVVTAVNDQPVNSRDAIAATIDHADFNTLHWVSQDGRKMARDFAPGEIGFASENFPRPLTWYILRGTRDPAWDRDIAVALTALETRRKPGHLDLAETALARALEAGHPADLLMRVQATEFAIWRNRFSDAAALLDTLPALPRDNPLGPSLGYQHLIASATYQPRRVAALVPEHAAFNKAAQLLAIPLWVQDLDAMFDPNAPSPVAAAEGARRTRLNSQLTRDPNYFNDRPAWFANQIIKSNPINQHIPPAEYHVGMLQFPQDVGDFEVVIRFGAQGKAPEDSHWYNLLNIRIFDGDRLFEERWIWHEPINVLGVQMHFPPDEVPRLGMAYGPFPIYPMTHAPYLGGGSGAGRILHFLRVGSRGQILVDNHPVLDVPVDPDVTNLRLFIHAVGMHLHFQEVTVNALEID